MKPSALPLRHVILCADDFAVNASASQGIAELAAAGRLSAGAARDQCHGAGTALGTRCDAA